MRKILLDFSQVGTPEELQDYLASVFRFPDYYGKNLDALYDMLTELGEYTCVGVFEPEKQDRSSDFDRYLYRVKRVLRDAETGNPRLCVIFADIEENETVNIVEIMEAPLKEKERRIEEHEEKQPGYMDAADEASGFSPDSGPFSD